MLRNSDLEAKTLIYVRCHLLLYFSLSDYTEFFRLQRSGKELHFDNLFLLKPLQVGVLLRAMGYPPKTIVYVAGSETFGGQRMLIPLRAMFNNLVDRTSFCSEEELASIFGPETTLPLDFYRPPPSKSEQQLKDDWNKAGPRPRPLPPPPDRPIYRHEKEGWYGWITETDKEPDPSPMDLRLQAHRLLFDALDYMVCLEADAFFPGFNNDGSNWPDFSSMVMGQRLYESSSSRTYRPDRYIKESNDEPLLISY